MPRFRPTTIHPTCPLTSEPQVGADGAVFLRVFKLGLQLFAVCSVVACGLIAVNASGENNLDGLIGLSMANIDDGSPLLWGPVVGMWIISLIAYYTLWKNYNEVLAITQEYKVSYRRSVCWHSVGCSESSEPLNLRSD